MFERFTERARRALFFARYEASQLGSAGIDTEHLLLGLIREGKGLITRLFADAGVASDDLRAEVLRRVPSGPTISTSVEIPFSAAAKRALQYAAQEADGLSHDYIGTEHLLLGLLREQGSVAADVLTSRGLRLNRVREKIVEFLGSGEQPGHPGPAGTAENTLKRSRLRFVPSRAAHILYSEVKPLQPPVTSHSGSGWQACGYTLTDAIVQAWRGNRWHIDIVDGVNEGTRYDFYIQLAQQESDETFQQLWREAIERQFEISVTRETRLRDVWVVKRIAHGGPMLRHHEQPEQGSGFVQANLGLVMSGPDDAPVFPLQPFAVHSVPFAYLARWLEEVLDGPAIDETGLRGTCSFELTRAVATREELIDLLRDQAGVSITREARATPTLVVRPR